MYTFDSLWRHGYRMSTALLLEFCSASNNSSRGYYAFIFQALFSMAFLHFIYTGATHHMTSNPAAFVSSSPYQGKSVVFTGDHTLPYSLFQTLVRSLYHLVLAMFFISMMLCWFLKSVSQEIFSVGQLCDDRQSYAIFTPTSSVLSRIYTRIMS